MSLLGVLQALALLLVVVVALLRTIAYYLRTKQFSLLYFPEMPPDARVAVPHPSSYGMPHEDLEIITSDGVRICAYYMHAPATAPLKEVTLVHFHGNAGNIGHRLPLARLFIERLGCNVVLAEYRGYGESETPEQLTEEGLALDAVAVLDYVRNLTYVNPDGVVVHGTSLGGAVGIELARRCGRKMAALIIENTFTSISDMVDTLFATILTRQPLSPAKKDVLYWVVTLFLKPVVLMLHWRSIDKIGELRIPMLFVAGSADEIVPHQHMNELFKHCKVTTKQLAVIEGGSHNATFEREESLAEMKRFLHEHVVPQAAVTTAASGAGANASSTSSEPGDTFNRDSEHLLPGGRSSSTQLRTSRYHTNDAGGSSP